MLRRIELHGILGEKFGKHFQMDIETVREATVALASQIKEFKRFMLEADTEGLKFAVFTDSVEEGTNVAEEDFASITGAWIETSIASAYIFNYFRVHHGRVD